MAQKGRIDDFFDLAAMEKQLATAIGLIGKWVKAVEDGSGAKLSLKGATKPSDIAAGTEKVTTAMREQSKIAIKAAEENKAVLNLIKQRFATEAKLVTIQTDYARETIKGRLEIAKTTKELKAQAAIDLAAPNSLERVRAMRAKIRIEVDQTNLTDTKRLEILNKQIDKLSNIEKKYVDQGRAQSLNVGNYVGSAKIIVDALERARTKVVAVGRSFGETSPEAAAARKEFEALDRITGNPAFLNISAKVGDTNKELRFFTQRLNELDDAGLKNSTVYKEVQARLAQLTDQLGDTKQEIKALASDSRSFDLFAGSVKFAADTFQTAAGAAVLFGASEEDAQKATATLTAVMAVSNGVKGIATELTTKGTAANKVYSFFQGLVATSLDRTAAASVRAAAATKLLFASLTVIGAVVLAITLFRRRTDEAEKSQKNLNDALKEGSSEYGKAIETVSTLRNEIELAKNGTISSDKVTKHFNETIGETTGQVNSLSEAEASLNKNAEAYIQFTFAKAVATAALAKAAQLAVDQQLLLLDKTPSSEEQAIRTLGVLSDDKIKEIVETDKKNKQNAISKQITDLQNFSKQQLDVASGIAKDKKFNFLGTAGADDKAAEDAAKKRLEKAKEAAKDAKEKADAELQFEFDLQAIKLKRQDDYNKEIADNEKKSFDERILAERLSYNARVELITTNAELQKKLGTKTAKEIEVIEATKNDALIRLDEESGKEIVGITISNGEKIKAAKEKLAQEDKEHQDSYHEIQLQSIQNRYDKELIQLDEKFADGLIKEEEYNDKKFALQQDLNEAIITENIRFAQQQISILKLIAANETDPAKKKKQYDDIAKAEQDLAALQISLIGLGVDAKVRASDKVKKITEEEKQAIIKTFGEIRAYSEVAIGLIGGLIGANAEKEKNILQGQIDDLEKKKQKDIEVANQTITNSQDRAAAIAVIEARAAAQREAIERRQRQLDEQKAKFEKAATIFRISLDLAEAIATLNVFKAIAAAAQLAVAIATPIPKYKHGTQNHPGGKAMVGDGGVSEAVELPSGEIIKTPSTPVIWDLPKGSKVYPDYSKMMIAATLTNVPEFKERSVSDSSLKVVAELKEVKKAIYKIPQTSITVANPLSQRIKYGTSINDHITRNLGR